MIKLPGFLLSLLLSCLLALFLLAGEPAQSVGIIGGADGPTAIFLSDTASSASVIGGADSPTAIYISNGACPVCNGAGTLPADTGEPVVCPACGGEGVLALPRP